LKTYSGFVNGEEGTFQPQKSGGKDAPSFNFLTGRGDL
jgi:hypothetical protein